jgi:hypothetical protein
VPVIWKLGVMGVLLMAAACGDDDDDERSNRAAVESCVALCDAQVAGQECPPGIADFCKRICTSVVAVMPADCAAKGQTYFECGLQVEWSCGGAADVAPCQSQAEAWYECSGQTN